MKEKGVEAWERWCCICGLNEDILNTFTLYLCFFLPPSVWSTTWMVLFSVCMCVNNSTFLSVLNKKMLLCGRRDGFQEHEWTQQSLVKYNPPFFLGRKLSNSSGMTWLRQCVTELGTGIRNLVLKTLAFWRDHLSVSSEWKHMNCGFVFRKKRLIQVGYFSLAWKAQWQVRTFCFLLSSS